MPASSKRGKQRPGGMWVGTLVVVVGALAIVAVAFYLWSRSSASGTAEKFVKVQLSLLTSSQPDFAALKELVTNEDAADIEKMEAAFSQMGGSNPLAGMMGEVKSTCEVQKVSVGLSEATVVVKTTVEVGSFSQSNDANIILVREGLAWKVSAKRTGEAFTGGGTQMAPQT